MFKINVYYLNNMVVLMVSMGTSGANAIACAIKAKETTFTSIEHPMEWEI